MIDNVVDTVTLYALSDTPVNLPSGLMLSSNPHAVRTDNIATFDFAFDIDTAGRAVLLPTGAMHLGTASGGQLSDTPFDSIKIAPTSGYQRDSAIVLDTGAVAILHSRPTGCSFFAAATYFFYAKLHVIALDMKSRRIDIELLADINCGYRGLEPGLPPH